MRPPGHSGPQSKQSSSRNMGGYPLPRSRREAPATVRYQRLGPDYIDPSPSSSEEACLDKLAATAPLTKCGTFSHPGQSLYPCCQSNPPNPNPSFASFWSSNLPQHSIYSTVSATRQDPGIVTVIPAKLRCVCKGYVRVRGCPLFLMTIRDSAFLTRACSRTSHLSDSAVVSSTYFLVSRAEQ